MGKDKGWLAALPHCVESEAPKPISVDRNDYYWELVAK